MTPDEAKAKKKAANKAYREAKSAELKVKQHAYREANKAVLAERQKQWRDNNKARVTARKKAHYQRNADELRDEQRVWRRDNPELASSRGKAYREADPQRYSELRRCRAYGLTKEQYRRIVEEHGGACAVCGGAGGRTGLCFDHDHATGEVRGMLCSQCNTAIGLMKDSPLRLRAAATYLDRRQPTLRLLAK